MDAAPTRFFAEPTGDGGWPARCSLVAATAGEPPTLPLHGRHRAARGGRRGTKHQGSWAAAVVAVVGVGERREGTVRPRAMAGEPGWEVAPSPPWTGRDVRGWGAWERGDPPGECPGGCGEGGGGGGRRAPMLLHSILLFGRTRFSQRSPPRRCRPGAANRKARRGYDDEGGVPRGRRNPLPLFVTENDARGRFSSAACPHQCPPSLPRGAQQV